MSLNSESARSGGGGGGAGAERAPRLQNGAGYAQWRARMHAFLQARGAEGVHTRKETQEVWQATAGRVARWADEDYARALAEADGAESAGSAALKLEAQSDAQRAARKLITAAMERSKRAYAHLFGAL